MNQGLRLIIGQKCIVCGVVAGHEDDCPVEKVRAFFEAKVNREHPCPICHRGDVAINKDDYWECRKCKVQLAAGPAIMGEDAETLKKAVILPRSADSFGSVIYVYVMKAQGRGKFRDDEIANMLMAEKNRALEEARKRKEEDG